MIRLNGYDEIQTGDICLFSRNDFRGFLMRCTMKTKWYHVGIAVRIKNKKIVKSGGDFYILDLIHGKRHDLFEDKIVKGFGLSKIEDCMKIYNYGAFRKLKDENLRTKCITKIKEFHKKYNGKLVHDDKLSFIKLWLQTTIYKNSQERGFCSQIASKFYRELSDLNHNEIFCTSNDFISDEFITPQMFSYEYSYNSKLFENEEEKIFFERKSDIKSVIIGPLLIFFIFLILIIFLLMLFIYYPVLEKKYDQS